MSNGNPKSADQKSSPAAYKVQAVKAATEPPPPAGKQPPLFRSIDWLAFGLTTFLVFLGYFLTLAPNLTLEDSGELAVGSYYAGIPHPPGYPAWTLYTWLFSHLVPISNIAYRVAMAEALAGAFACGLLALIVSRGSSMMIEGITAIKDMDKRWENSICLVSGFVSGMVIGFNGYMWSQSVIVEVYSFSMLSMMAMLLFFLRWVYAPHQRRYLYIALFIFGVCVTNHQTLLVAAMGVEIVVIAGQPRLGRDFLFGNSVLYLVGLVAKSQHILTGMDANQPVFVIYNCIGILSIVGCIWLFIQYPKTLPELQTDGLLLVAFGLPVIAFVNPSLAAVAGLLAFAALGVFVWRSWKYHSLENGTFVIFLCGVLWLAGAAFYFWMPIAGMSNPPMQWGYPRTVEGFWHALSRGQYEKTVPTDLLSSPFHYFYQMGLMFDGIVEEFNWVYALLALIPFAFYMKMQRRERAWMTGLFGIYCCMGFFLLLLLNPNGDRQSVEIGRVQFTASHFIVTIFLGYGLTLITAYMFAHYKQFRMWGIIGGSIASVFALYTLAQTTQTFQGENNETGISLFFYTIGNVFAKDHYTLPIMADLLLLAITVCFTLSLVIRREKAAMPLVLGLFALMPLHPIMTHWFDNEERGHMFGYWFGHDMFTPPFINKDGKFSYDAKERAEMVKDPQKARAIYPEMARDAVLYGGTDPGRFCPTYMIFDESFIPPSKKADTDPNYDRRDVYIITQNALADGTYLMYIRAHYNRSAQLKYDLPFFQELARGAQEKELNYKTNGLARLVSPLDHLFGGIGQKIERERRAGSSFFVESDFTDLTAFAARLQKHDAKDLVSVWLYNNLSKSTQQLLGGPANSSLAAALAKDLNVLLERELLDSEKVATLRREEDQLEPEMSVKDKTRKDAIEAEIKTLSVDGTLYTADRFAGVTLPDTTVKFVAQNPQSDTRIRLNRLLLEAAYPKLIAASKGGVYPDREIYIATPDDSQRCFQDYMADAQRRLQAGQLKPGENVQMLDNRVQVSGQVAVMAINGLLTKVMFDANPDHEFYVEESFPLDWMYPNLTPFGVIMKINREPLPELNDDIVYRDHEFWSKYSERLIGNWITYDTSVKDICDWVEKVYLRHDFRGFKGDLKFVRDDQAQKAFSKLRSSIGGIYAWRINDSARRNSPTEQQRMIKEADFTFRQSFAFCPYSPEAVFRYVQLLVNIGRVSDALLIAKTCLKFDPENGQVRGLVDNLSEASTTGKGAHDPIEKLEANYQTNPNDFQNALNLAATEYQRGQTNRADEILDGLIKNPKADRGLVVAIAQIYIQMNNYPKLEAALERLVQVSPEQAEAWYDLAALKAAFGKNTEAITDLTKAIDLNDQQNHQPKNLRTEATGDARFAPLRSLPEFQKLVTPGK